MPTAPVNSIYKVYNGTEWVTYYFRTSAALVGVTNSRKFITNKISINGKGFENDTNDAEVGFIVLSGSDIQAGYDARESARTVYTAVNRQETATLTSTTAISDYLLKLADAVNAAYDNVPDDVVTYTNFASASINGMFLVNNGTPNQIEFTGENLFTDSTKTTHITTAINEAIAVANGVTKSCVIDNTQQDQVGSVVNSRFQSTAATLEIEDTNATTAFAAKLQFLDGRQILLSDLKVGDTVFVTQTDVPDRWLASIITDATRKVYTFYNLETYNMQWNAIASKPTTLQGYGITDALSASDTTVVKTTGNQSIGGVKTFESDIVLADPQDSDGTQVKFTSSRENFRITLIGGQGNTTKYFDLGLGNAFSGNSGTNTIATQEWVSAAFASKWTIGSTAPQNPATNDLWIDTSN